MTYVAMLLGLFAVDFLAVVTPGPNFLLVTATSMRHGRRSGEQRSAEPPAQAQCKRHVSSSSSDIAEV